MAARGWATSGRATISTPPRCVALDGKTGTIKGHFQYHQNDSWDWDEVSPPILVDYQRGGRTIKGLVDVARDGYLWQLERTDGKINFVTAQNFVQHNVFKGVEPGTGRPIVDPEHKPGTDKTASFCPSLWGGKDWPPVAYSPQTRLLYIPANENLCSEVTAEVPKYVAGERYTGVTKNVLRIRANADHIGELQAWNLDTGKRCGPPSCRPRIGARCWRPPAACCSPAAPPTGIFRAFDAKTGAILWQYPTISGVNGVPVSFAVDGKQYIAVQSRLGRRCGPHAAGAEPAVPGPVFGRATRRRGICVCGEVRGGCGFCRIARRRDPAS